ncbi:MAG: hypothetical protein ACPGKS_05510 [Coraliomargarita sp.]
MFTCKQVSKSLHEEGYENLSPLRKFFLRLHIRLCVFCGRFNTQVVESQEMCSHFKKHEEEMIGEQPHLDPAKKDALQELIAQKSRES